MTRIPTRMDAIEERREQARSIIAKVAHVAGVHPQALENAIRNLVAPPAGQAPEEVFGDLREDLADWINSSVGNEVL